MVKMRVKEDNNLPDQLKKYMCTIIDVELCPSGNYKLKYDSCPILFFPSELEPVEEAAPTKETTESRPTLLALPPESAGKGVSITNVSDPVSNPSHYKFSQYEPVKVIQAWGLSFCLGNVVKYIARAGRKDSSKLIEDLEKARRYIELEIEALRQSNI